MIRHVCGAACFTLIIINLAGALDLQPPRDVRIVKSHLEWKSDNNVLYTVQYTFSDKSVDDWHNVSSHIRTNSTKFEIPSEFHGAVFRVRAEMENRTSEWRNSSTVQCVNIRYCVPLILNLTVKPGVAHLSMAHMDQSLKKEYGDHISFNISYWKVANGGHSEVHFVITKNENQAFPNLESQQTYCFQVQYLHYEKPYGNTSNKTCDVIPETLEEAQSRALLTSILMTLIVTALCVGCIFALLKNRKRIKQVLQPPLEIPDHYREYFMQEFPQQPLPSPSSESLRSCDIITFRLDGNMEENSQEEEKERIS